MEARGGFQTRITPDLVACLAQIDTAYLATANEAGQPYVQHRRGPKGFIHALDETTLGFAETSIIAMPDLLVEVFDCDADGNPMEGIWLQQLNDRGEISDLTVYLRPYPAVTVLRNRTKELGEKTGVLVGRDYWELAASAA